MTINFDNIPADPRRLPRWLVWREEPGKNGKPTKVPYDPSSGHAIDVQNPRSWTNHAQAQATYEANTRWNGIGFAVRGSGIVAIDMDACVEDGVVESWARDILDQLRSYSEISPSGHGIRILLRGELPDGKRQTKWDGGREILLKDSGYVTVTGARLDDYPWAVHERSAELAALHAELFPATPETQVRTAGVSRLDDQTLVDRIRNSKQAAKFNDLWAGDWCDYPEYPSQSEADIGLCQILAFWTNRDPAAIDRLFRQSGLYRDQWAERSDYRTSTIQRAIGRTSETYQPPQDRPVNNSNGATSSPAPAHTPDVPVTLGDFLAYLPEHKYIYRHTRELWPAASVNARMKPVPVDGEDEPIKASTWLDRYQPVQQMAWAPGEFELVKGRLISHGGWFDRAGDTTYNLYRPPIIAHGNSDEAGPWIEHVHRVYPAEAEHILDWLAHRVQRPQEKINHALVLGGQQGIGKDTLLEPVKHATGPWNFWEIAPSHLLGRFNGFVKSVILRGKPATLATSTATASTITSRAIQPHHRTYCSVMRSTSASTAS